eukprot:CAMPEP_0184486474 /NCGR_PEP_ID=MMETSP0113_2-20130426/7962_1 /TAXON_ID=91329 /ORGANISM="Norrisiella sphaerica, Strain BC52" /LENGTH=61 /DNA_ID=CAMNT_0026868371 /DNA_START=174 /DNA_END=359 /DNA_ORIENTATION=+
MNLSVTMKRATLREYSIAHRTSVMPSGVDALKVPIQVVLPVEASIAVYADVGLRAGVDAGV